MLESAEVGHTIAKAAYAREEPRLREALLNAQYDLSQSQKGPVLLIITGVEGGGRSETANKLTEWMDPRHIRVIAFGPRACEELVRPPAWRYWRALPPKGGIGIFLNAWYTEIVQARLDGKLDKAGFEFYLQETRSFERMLVDEGFVLLKFWIHLSHDALAARLRELKRAGKRTPSAFKLDYKLASMYQKLRPLWEEMLRETSTAEAPWTVVEGTDERYRHLTVGKVLLDAMKGAVVSARAALRHPRAAGPAPAAVDNVKLIRSLDLTQRLSADEYQTALTRWRTRLYDLTQNRRFREHSLVLAFEGVDAAGKGGAIRRVTGALDARQYVGVPIAAPTEEERKFPYLWRFATCRLARALRSSIGAGTAACWSNASRALARNSIGGARTMRSTSSKSSSLKAVRCCASSGCRSARRSSCGGSRRARKRRSSVSRSRPTTGAIARNGMRTSRQ